LSLDRTIRLTVNALPSEEAATLPDDDRGRPIQQLAPRLSPIYLTALPGLTNSASTTPATPAPRRGR